ncbi:MAG TPA: hypothetical protein VF163_19670, partial [Micromonosporaceae bacterium]
AVGRRAVRRGNRTDGITARAVAALSAALGASAAIAVAWLPARAATPPVSVNAGLMVTLTAGGGIIAGIVIALAATSVRPVSVGIQLTVLWIWTVAAVSAVAGIWSHQPFAAPRLAVLDAPSLVPTAWWTGPYLVIAVSAAIGVLAALVMRLRGAHRFAVALAGLGGPALVATAYLISGPSIGPNPTAQFEPYLASLIAAGAGLVASVIVALPTRSEPEDSLDEDGADEYDADLDEEPIMGEVLTTDRLQRSQPLPAASLEFMGQPPQSFEREYSSWLHDIGPDSNEPAHGQWQRA